jgi:hypothetical protein
VITRSESVGELMKALGKLQASIGVIEKTATNPAFKNSKYAPIASILEALEEPEQTSGLVISQWPTDDGAVAIHVHHLESDQWMQSTLKLHPAKPDPQGIVAAITYAKRCQLTGVLKLKLDPDDDGNLASNRKAPDKGEKEAAKSRVVAQKLVSKSEFKKVLSDISAQRKKLKDIEPADGAEAKAWSEQKKAFGIESPDDLANNQVAARQILTNLMDLETSWKSMGALTLGPDDIPTGLTVRDFTGEEYALVAAWIHSKDRKAGEYLAKWEGTKEDALEEARAWKGL